ncbi:MAG: hypothetical protein Q6373_019905 [Candidatus Sigynarchaeota archaeon]
MFKLHAYFVFHLSQRCMLFYGQIEPKDVAEETFTNLFVEAEKLLIGQSKLVTMDNSQFVLLNQEDIISCALVSDVSKQDEKSAINLLTKLGKAFKRQYQAEIDEFDPNSCDLGATFGGFSSILATALKDFLAPKDNTSGEEQKEIPGNQGSTAPKPAAGEEGKGIRFPGGKISPEERDEILFHEYEDLMALYNVEMVDGIVSKNKIFIYANIGEYHEITVDYSDFPAVPKITMPAKLSDVLAITQTVQGWNPENPPRIVDVIAEIEQIVCSMHPAGPTQADRAAEIDGYMDELGFEGSGEKATNGLSQGEKTSASNVLASRLLAKDKNVAKNGEKDSNVPNFSQPSTIVDQIIDESQQLGHKTSLKDMVAKQKAGETSPQQVASEPSPSLAAVPTPTPSREQKPQKFVIRPRFVVDGEEITPGKKEPEPEPSKPAPRKESVPPPKIGIIDEGITITPRPRPASMAQGEQELMAKPVATLQKIDEVDHDIDITARPRPASQIKNFAIPDVNELDSFVPPAPMKRPAIKPAPAQKQAPPSPVKPAQKPAPAATAKSKPAPKRIDDEEDMFGWGDGEMEVKQSNVEIKDFDGPIKKITNGE